MPAGPSDIAFIPAPPSRSGMGKLDRVLGAFCLAFSAFFLVAARSVDDSRNRLGGAVGAVTLAIALLAAIPGIWLIVRGRSV